MNFKNFRIGIVGTGAMGRGIAQIAVLSGINVILYDISEQAIKDAHNFVSSMINRLVEKKRISKEKADDAVSRLFEASSLDDMADCGLVMEAIVEKLDAKQDLFCKLEDIVAPDCILATNTSSLSVTAIASKCIKPERIAGFHFFNPVPLMKVVEVVKGVMTSDNVCYRLAALAEHMGHTPVHAKDTPGFIVNHAGRAYGTESTSIVEEGVADFRQVDSIMRTSAGFRMGPFELYDLTGLDVSHPATEAIFNQFYNEPRYRPSYMLRQRFIAGLLGRKTGQGFYSYNKENLLQAEKKKIHEFPKCSVWISRENTEGFTKVSEMLFRAGIKQDENARPSVESLCVVTPLGKDATTCATEQNLDPKRTVAIDTLIGFDSFRTVMTTPVTDAEFKEYAKAVFTFDGTPMELINDSFGFVAQRVLAMIVNTGCFIAQHRIASPADIDMAVKLGLGYPYGPLEFGDVLGSKKILDILQAIYAGTGDPRYRPCPWLVRRAKLEISLQQQE